MYGKRLAELLLRVERGVTTKDDVSLILSLLEEAGIDMDAPSCTPSDQLVYNVSWLSFRHGFLKAALQYDKSLVEGARANLHSAMEKAAAEQRDVAAELRALLLQHEREK